MTDRIIAFNPMVQARNLPLYYSQRSIGNQNNFLFKTAFLFNIH